MGGLARQLVGKEHAIDIYGDAVMNYDDLPGDTWRYRHDTIKNSIVSECLDAKLPHDCEVYGLFSDLLPAAVEN